MDCYPVCLCTLTYLLTSPAGVVAKHYNEYICVSVCLSTRISPEPHARSLPNYLCILPMAWSSSGRVTKFREEGPILEFSSPLTMHFKA